MAVGDLAFYYTLYLCYKLFSASNPPDFQLMKTSREIHNLKLRNAIIRQNVTVGHVRLCSRVFIAYKLTGQ